MLGAIFWSRMTIPERSEGRNPCSKIYFYNVYAQVPQPGNPPEPSCLWQSEQLPRKYKPINPDAKVPGDS